MGKISFALSLAALAAVFLFTQTASAHTTDWGGWEGHGKHARMGRDGDKKEPAKKDYSLRHLKRERFFEKTAGLRKTLHMKKFELREALRAGKWHMAGNLRKEIHELRARMAGMRGAVKERFAGRHPGGRGERFYFGRHFGGGPCGGPY